MNIFKKIIYFFDKLEDKIRGRLSRMPLVYAFIGGVGIVLFWRGVWHIADGFEGGGGIISLIIGSIILLLSGAFVSAFIGNRLILTGIRGEKKLTEKSTDEIESELATEESELRSIKNVLLKVEDRLEKIENELPHDHNTK
jgi:hypothetical protein